MNETLSTGDLPALLPLIVLGGLVLAQLGSIALARHHGATALLTLGGLALAIATLPVAAAADDEVGALIVADRFSIFFFALITGTAFAAVVLSYGYLRGRDELPEEFYVLGTLATLGAAVLAMSAHFASFFLGIEVLSVSLYALIAYRRQGEIDVEAATKYLVLAGVSSAFLLFGMALVYGEIGAMGFGEIAEGVAAAEDPGTMLLAAIALLVVGIGFKLALVPFHMWTPDVYEGAPAPAAALIATVSKGGVFAVVLRFFNEIGFQDHAGMIAVVAVVAVASMIAGNLLALMQQNIKRLLAYSSIAHLGYLLVGLMAGGAGALTAASFYLVAYFAAVMAAFGVVIVLSAEQRDADTIAEYRGLFWRQPLPALVLALALLSLAGIPVSAGFVGKFLLVAAGADSDLWIPVGALVLGSLIGFVYYLRVLLVMFAESEARILPVRAASFASNAVLAVLLVVIVGLGIYPAPLVDLIESFVRLS